MRKIIAISLALILIVILSASSIYGFQSSVVDKDVVYNICQGINLTMDLYYPESTGLPVPVIVYIHGGGWYSGDKTDAIGRNNIPELTGRGYLVAAVNYRLAPRYVFPAQIEDVRCAIRFLKTHATLYNLDPNRIGVFGDSAGGHLAALLGLSAVNSELSIDSNSEETSTRVQAVVDLFGPTDLESFFENNRDLLFLEHIFNTDDPESQIIKQASPINYVTQDAPPFLLIHGDQDKVVLLDQSEKLYRKLLAAGVPTNLIVVKNCGHELVPSGGSIQPDSSLITQTIGDFFDRYLK